MSNATVVLIDDRNWVVKPLNHDVKLRDPAPYGKNEAHFGPEPTDRANPIRLPANYVPTHEVEGEQVTILWKYAKVIDYVVVEMTEEEKAIRDAEIEAEKEAEELTEKEAIRDWIEANDSYRATVFLLRAILPEQYQPTNQQAIDAAKKAAGLI